MAIIGRMQKQPAEVLDYDVDFSQWLPGDHIVSATVTATPNTDLSVDSYTVVDDTWLKIWLSGGLSGVTYKIEVTVTTYDGRVKQAEFTVAVLEV